MSVECISSLAHYSGSKCDHGVTAFPYLPTRTDIYHSEGMATRGAFARTFGFSEQQLDVFGSREVQDIVLGIRDDLVWRGESHCPISSICPYDSSLASGHDLPFCKLP